MLEGGIPSPRQFPLGKIQLTLIEIDVKRYEGGRKSYFI